ncbi:MAG: hypothetical protein C4581_11665 [Nitrospiraceae bacterium]|nr:MAG: hypothetical protein C4581_11665 [Nitrospiraceae bacterium]
MKLSCNCSSGCSCCNGSRGCYRYPHSTLLPSILFKAEAMSAVVGSFIINVVVLFPMSAR